MIHTYYVRSALFTVLLLVVSFSHTVTIENVLREPLHVAVYAKDGHRKGDVHTIASGDTVTLRSEKEAGDLIQGAVSAADLLDQLPESTYVTTTYDASSKDSIRSGLLGNEIILYNPQKTSTITVTNTTDMIVYAALYYQSGSQALRFGEPVEVLAGATATLLRPLRVCKKRFSGACVEYVDRNVYVSTDKDLLTPRIDSQIREPGLASFNVGELKGSAWYVVTEYGHLKGIHETTWKTLHRVEREVTKFILAEREKRIKEAYQGIAYPGKGERAKVRRGPGVSDQETAVVAERQRTVVKPAFQKLFNTQTATRLPVVAFCCSGGGYRAMNATLGMLTAAERNGLLSLATYISSLSGSTWAIAGWRSSGLSMSEYADRVTRRLYPSITKNIHFKFLEDAFVIKAAFHQPTSAVDAFGAMLAGKLLAPYAPHGNYNYLWLGARDEQVETGAVPLPIYTAVTPRRFDTLVPLHDPATYYRWVSFTPHEVSVVEAQMSVPSWAFGRTFVKGVSSHTDTPPATLGFCMGVWGSAFAVHAADTIRIGLNMVSFDISIAIMKAISQSSIVNYFVEQRSSPAQVSNFVEAGLMTLVDAGIAFNLPFPPLLKPVRSADIIIVLDSTDGAPGNELLHAGTYARTHNIPFPRLDTKRVRDLYAVHWDREQRDAPAVIALRLAQDLAYGDTWDPWKERFTASFNMEYTEAQARKLQQQSEKIFERHSKTIMAVIKEWIELNNPPVQAL